jgi:hypothetical protein
MLRNWTAIRRQRALSLKQKAAAPYPRKEEKTGLFLDDVGLFTPTSGDAPFQDGFAWHKAIARRINCIGVLSGVMLRGAYKPRLVRG